MRISNIIELDISTVRYCSLVESIIEEDII